ncbi:MAG: LD-carboxypeptidase [Lachnospiraceae bacterium]|nr:LD-carboxypeptidase [Lachnospiraceae bacterium]
MKFADFLKEKGKISFVAPSFGCNIEPYKTGFNEALKKFKEMGYVLETGPNAYAGEGVGISNTPEKCAEELMNYYLRNEDEVIISCGGGELMCEILEFLDFEKIKESKPKWYLGYSDNTNFIFPLTTIADIAGIYGPCAPSFGIEWHQSQKDSFDILTGKKLRVSNYDAWEIESLKDENNPLEPYNLTEAPCMCVNDTSVSNIRGRLVGGCLDCLEKLCGTKFDNMNEFSSKYKDDGIIFFLESCDLSVFDMRRAIWHLKHAGWFKYVKGFLIGRPMHFNEPMFGLDRHEAVLANLKEFNVPVLMDLDFGHLPPAMPLISGAIADIKWDNSENSISDDEKHLFKVDSLSIDYYLK